VPVPGSYRNPRIEEYIELDKVTTKLRNPRGHHSCFRLFLSSSPLLAYMQCISLSRFDREVIHCQTRAVSVVHGDSSLPAINVLNNSDETARIAAAVVRVGGIGTDRTWRNRHRRRRAVSSSTGVSSSRDGRITAPSWTVQPRRGCRWKMAYEQEDTEAESDDRWWTEKLAPDDRIGADFWYAHVLYAGQVCRSFVLPVSDAEQNRCRKSASKTGAARFSAFICWT